MERNSMKGKATWLLESIYETAKVLTENSHDSKVRDLAAEHMKEIEQELARRSSVK